MDKAVKGTPSPTSGLSKVAKKRIAGAIFVIIFAILLVGMSASSRILGTWEFHKSVRGEGDDIVTYQFEENGIGHIYDKTSPEAAPHNVRSFGYAIDDSKLIILEDGDENVYDYTFTFNKLYFNDAEKNSLDYVGSFSPLLKSVCIVILLLLILWCFEEDFNAFLRAEGRWRRNRSKATRRICAAIAFAICVVFVLLAFLPSLRLNGKWDANINDNTAENIPDANRAATYTFNDDMSGHYYNVFPNGDVADETFKYDKEEVLSIVYPAGSALKNSAYVLADNPEIKAPETYTIEDANISLANVTVKGKTYPEVVLESVTYEFSEDNKGVLIVEKGYAYTPAEGETPSEKFEYSAEDTTNLRPDQLALFDEVDFTYSIGTDLVLNFDNDGREEIYEYAFWFDTLFLDRVGDGDVNTYDSLYTIDTWFNTSFKLIVAAIALILTFYFLSVDLSERKKRKEDLKKLKEAEKAKRKVAAM